MWIGCITQAKGKKKMRREKKKEKKNSVTHMEEEERKNKREDEEEKKSLSLFTSNTRKRAFDTQAPMVMVIGSLPSFFSSFVFCVHAKHTSTILYKRMSCAPPCSFFIDRFSLHLYVQYMFKE
jgi:hypothetical protein